MPVSRLVNIAGRRGRDIRVEELTSADPELYSLPRPEREIRERFAKGARCLVAHRAGRVLGFVWFAFGVFREPELDALIELEPGQRFVWDFDVYVQPEERLSVAFARLWQGAGQWLTSLDVQWSVSMVWARNTASLTAHARAGAVAVAEGWKVNAWRMQRVFIRNLGQSVGVDSGKTHDGILLKVYLGRAQ